ncbi:nucleoside diphosphate kinase chloroplastic isoform A [Chlorella sorokiniana]|uniref:Nucleoside diphosphate kinase n=1 Tax=Chlorella sorokiniana TaxID=3076 RepID=A0A2P6TVZ8_CHLSO|nr:nucleoside diphosphate kinase chloroplastic isoform A [Chlorella sorokiniana]|eukprot:PRW58239.1 nucleoside diphosphate kinase chloroplastic isoform A [Chlorella sorokiniana]
MAATQLAASCRFAAASSTQSRAGRRTHAAFVTAPAQRLASVSSISAASSLAPAAAVRAPRCRAAAAVSVRSEITYVMIKPDGVQRGLVGEIISRFEKKGFKLVQLKMMKVTKEVAEEHYKDLKDKPFFPDLIGYILSGPVVGMVWEGQGVVKAARKIIGATNPLEAEPGTIRGDLAVQTGRNVVHGSDSPENGERETALWFSGHGIVEWEAHMKPWLVE